MNRRDFVAALGGALACPGALYAQPSKPGESRMIGVLGLGFETEIPVAQRPTSIALRKLGWIEGDNLIVVRSYANLQAERLAELAEELVRKRVQIIWTIGPDATLAAARATKSIPIVFFNASNPVEIGLVDSLARPGRNATGTSFSADMALSAKMYEFLREIAPAAKRVSRLWQPDAGKTIAGGTVDEVVRAGTTPAVRLGFELRSHEIRKLHDIDSAFAEITAWRAHALVATGGEHIHADRKRIAEFALLNRIPCASVYITIVEAGGLLAYGVARSEFEAMNIRGVEYIDRILRGAKPGELPIQRPSKYELVVNARTAKALGLKIPQTLLARADRVIE